jgi:hypothetical protein
MAQVDSGVRRRAGFMAMYPHPFSRVTFTAPGRSQHQRSLVLVHSPGMQSRSDFETIQQKLAVRAPDIDVLVVSNRMRQMVSARQAARLPSLVFTPRPLEIFKPLRGKILAGRQHTKVEEMTRLRQGGFRVPESTMIGPDTVLDPAVWGPFIVVKPNRGSHGGGVRLHRTRDVKWRDPKSWPRNDPRYGFPLIAQRFIDTGKRTSHYRIMVVLGRPVYGVRSLFDNERPYVLDPNGTEPLDVPAATNAEDSAPRTVSFCYEGDALEYAGSVARAFPERPALGVDLVREEATGDLYVLEVNAGGQTWHISSNYGLKFQRERKMDFMAQFGALDIIANALIEVTRREAA